ncbi:MAG: hypothetical protein HXY38_03735 [Chloroflexi bacterium]|nr:hypothetical protein [Chloroflexota bacterium]
MKNTKWIWRALAVLLTLAVLTGVGFAGFRVGIMQGANLTADGTHFMFQHGRGFEGGMKNFSPMQGFDRGHDGFGSFSPLFELIRLAMLGGLIWLGFTFLKNSGWRVVNVNNTPAAAPSPAEAEEKKEEA